MSEEKKMNRFRISVPSESTQVLEWIANQSNLSYAFLCVIREWIAKNGTGNVFAQHIDLLPKRGRPSNALRETMNQMQGDSQQSDVFESVSVDKQRSDNNVQQTRQPVRSEPNYQQDDDIDDDGFFNFEQNQSSGNTVSKSIIDMMNGK